MPESNRERLEELYREWAKGNFRAGTELFAPDISFETVSDGLEAIGREGIAGFMREFLAVWNDFRIEAAEIEDRGDEVIVTERQSGTGKASGIAMDQTNYAIWTFRDGLVVRIRWTFDRPD